MKVSEDSQREHSMPCGFCLASTGRRFNFSAYAAYCVTQLQSSVLLGWDGAHDQIIAEHKACADEANGCMASISQVQQSAAHLNAEGVAD